jgi:hypothetical protein
MFRGSFCGVRFLVDRIVGGASVVGIEEDLATRSAVQAECVAGGGNDLLHGYAVLLLLLYFLTGRFLIHDSISVSNHAGFARFTSTDEPSVRACGNRPSRIIFQMEGNESPTRSMTSAFDSRRISLPGIGVAIFFFPIGRTSLLGRAPAIKKTEGAPFLNDTFLLWCFNYAQPKDKYNGLL